MRENVFTGRVYVESVFITINKRFFKTEKS